MGPKMRLIPASYNAKQLSARSICDLALSIGSANSKERARRLERSDMIIHMSVIVLDKKITSLKPEGMGFAALAAPQLRW
jgi:hypothetical protein